MAPQLAGAPTALMVANRRAIWQCLAGTCYGRRRPFRGGYPKALLTVDRLTFNRQMVAIRKLMRIECAKAPRCRWPLVMLGPPSRLFVEAEWRRAHPRKPWWGDIVYANGTDEIVSQRGRW